MAGHDGESYSSADNSRPLNFLNTSKNRSPDSDHARCDPSS
jgi:hypothetical protein